MTLGDRYGLPLSTASPAARDAYVDGADRLLAAQPGMAQALEHALALDPHLALAHAALARVHQLHGRPAEARVAMRRASECDRDLTPRERGHLHALAQVVAGDGPGALAAIRAHLDAFPRDALVLMPCVGVFGLFGFSGRSGRERELAEFLAPLATHYGDDWWFRSVHAFARAELGEIEAARRDIDASLAAIPRNANGAHIRAHVDYEDGHDADGLAWLAGWLERYDRSGLMHCHLAWHVALWQLDLGRVDEAWHTYDAYVRPGGAWGPPLNVVTDGTSFLFRAELAGAPRPERRWRAVADYARAAYPSPGLAFVDAHVALALAMTGDFDALDELIREARGPAGDLVATLARGFGAFARGAWHEATDALGAASAQHERIGGSHAQRDLIDYAWLVAARHAGAPAARTRARPLPPALQPPVR